MTFAYHGHALRLWPRPDTRRWARRARLTSPLLGAGEHPLMREMAADGVGHYVATERALYHDAGGDRVLWQRIAWIEVARVEHSPTTGELTLRGWPGGGPSPARLAVAAGSRLPLLAHERVTAGQLLVRRIAVGDGTGCVVTALREPGTDQVVWAVHTNGTDPTLSASIERILRDIRGQAGC